MRVDPAFGFLREALRLGVARNPPGDEAHQGAPLGGRVAQLLGERGRDDEVRAEPVVEVLAEAAGLHLSRQVAVGGGDDLARKAPVTRVAESLEAPRLEHAQQLHLDGRVELADLVEEHRAQRRADLQPAGAVLHGARERAAAVAEQLRLDQRRRERRGVQGVERAGGVLGERLALGIERDVARQADRVRHQFLARARRPADERGDVAQPLIERAPIAPHVAREDGLPDGGAQSDDRRRVTNDVAEDVVERPADLEVAGQQVGHVAIGQQRGPRNLQEALDVLAEFPVEAHGGGRHAAVVEQPIELFLVAAEQQVDDHVLVELKVLGARPHALGEPRGQTPGQRLRELAERGHVRHRIGLAGGVPEGAAGHEGGAQRRALALDPLRQERVAVGQARDRLGEGAIAAG